MCVHCAISCVHSGFYLSAFLMPREGSLYSMCNGPMERRIGHGGTRDMEMIFEVSVIIIIFTMAYRIPPF